MRALIVDDSPSARAQARAALDEAAFALNLALDVDEADGGVEALRVLASVDIDVLLVDLHMPGVHGLEVLSFWHRRASASASNHVRTAVVISTAVSERDRQKASELGAVAFVEKPVTVEALTRLLTSLSSAVRGEQA